MKISISILLFLGILGPVAITIQFDYVNEGVFKKQISERVMTELDNLQMKESDFADKLSTPNMVDKSQAINGNQAKSSYEKKIFDELLTTVTTVQLPGTVITSYNQPETSNMQLTETSNVQLTKASNINMQLEETSNLQLTEASNVQVTEASNVQVTEASNMVLTETSNMQVTEASNMQLRKASNMQLTEASNMLLTEASNMLLTETSNMQLTEASNMQVTEISNMQLTEASNMQVTEISNVQLTDPTSVIESISGKANMQVSVDVSSEIHPTQPGTWTPWTSYIQPTAVMSVIQSTTNLRLNAGTSDTRPETYTGTQSRHVYARRGVTEERATTLMPDIVTSGIEEVATVTSGIIKTFSVTSNIEKTSAVMSEIIIKPTSVVELGIEPTSEVTSNMEPTSVLMSLETSSTKLASEVSDLQPSVSEVSEIEPTTTPTKATESLTVKGDFKASNIHVSDKRESYAIQATNTDTGFTDAFVERQGKEPVIENILSLTEMQPEQATEATDILNALSDSVPSGKPLFVDDKNKVEQSSENILLTTNEKSSPKKGSTNSSKVLSTNAPNVVSATARAQEETTTANVLIDNYGFNPDISPNHIEENNVATTESLKEDLSVTWFNDGNLVTTSPPDVNGGEVVNQTTTSNLDADVEEEHRNFNRVNKTVIASVVDVGQENDTNVETTASSGMTTETGRVEEAVTNLNVSTDDQESDSDENLNTAATEIPHTEETVLFSDDISTTYAPSINVNETLIPTVDAADKDKPEKLDHVKNPDNVTIVITNRNNETTQEETTIGDNEDETTPIIKYLNTVESLSEDPIPTASAVVRLVPTETTGVKEPVTTINNSIDKYETAVSEDETDDDRSVKFDHNTNQNKSKIENTNSTIRTRKAKNEISTNDSENETTYKSENKTINKNKTTTDVYDSMLTSAADGNEAVSALSTVSTDKDGKNSDAGVRISESKEENEPTATTEENTESENETSYKSVNEYETDANDSMPTSAADGNETVSVIGNETVSVLGNETVSVSSTVSTDKDGKNSDAGVRISESKDENEPTATTDNYKYVDLTNPPGATTNVNSKDENTPIEDHTEETTTISNTTSKTTNKPYLNIATTKKPDVNAASEEKSSRSGPSTFTIVAITLPIVLILIGICACFVEYRRTRNLNTSRQSLLTRVDVVPKREENNLANFVNPECDTQLTDENVMFSSPTRHPESDIQLTDEVLSSLKRKLSSRRLPLTQMLTETSMKSPKL